MENNVGICADLIRERTGVTEFSTAVVMGSGLGSLLNDADEKTVIPFKDLPGFPIPSVLGHAGNLISAKINKNRVIGLQGRSHLYEGHSPQIILNPIRTIKALGVKTLVLTNSAGSLNSNFAPGSLVVIRDHINLYGNNPLVGKNDDTVGPRFFDMTLAYTPALREKMALIGKNCNIKVHEGVYAYFIGPNFETPAEIRAMKILGADLVGMSTVPETLAAVHAGLDVVAVSCVTNFAAGISEKPLSHDETLSESIKMSHRMCVLIEEFLGN